MSLHWKMHTSFPFTRVFVLGIILFFLGLASMVISIIAFVTQSWGHYVGTGMWGGATILASGLTAVFVSRLKSLASVKTFCISSLIAMFTSLTMLILSAGGLTLSSGFYSRIDASEYNKRTSNLIHASLLVISVFCLSGNVLALIVCCKYIFFEHHEKPKHRRRHRNVPEGAVRTTSTLRGGAPNTSSQRSTNSRTPLHNESASRRHSDNTDINRVQIEYRRSHRRTASDQPHPNSRRQRHSHQEVTGCNNNNNNLLSASGARYYPPDRRNNSRSSSQAREMHCDNKETDRLNIAPLRQGSSSNNRPCSHNMMQVRLSNSPVLELRKIRLPTDFDEEELPPYEAVELVEQAEDVVGSGSDSGDESDTENSSSTDAHSYNAADVADDGVESVPMVEFQNGNRGNTHHSPENNLRQPSSSNIASNQPNRSHREVVSVQTQDKTFYSSSDNGQFAREEQQLSEGAGAMIVRKDSSRTNRPVLSYINTQSIDHLGEYERLLSVSPEVCAITGESPETVDGSESPERHAVDENFYENGPCYENIKCAGKGENVTNMNLLSQPSSSNLTSTQDKETNRETTESSRRISVQVISGSSPTTNSSPQPPQSSFGSILSAFRPVAPLVNQHSTSCGSAQKQPSQLSKSDNSSHRSVTLRNHCSPSPITYSNDPQAFVTTSGQSVNYREQGAIPKSGKHRESVPPSKDRSNLSWKNIPLPLSYNHTQSASNESEKKLPSKTIPFAESNKHDHLTLSNKYMPAQTEESSKLSPRVYPTSSFKPSSSSSKSTSLPVSLVAASSKCGQNSAETSRQSNNTNLKQSQVEPTPAKVNTSSREASTQASSSSSRWHSHRMGGNQSLLQSRREEMQNSQLSRRVVEASARITRPSSMPAAGEASNGINHGVSADRQSRVEAASLSAANTSDSGHPLSLRSYLVNHMQQQSQSLALRQNHLLQHYPLQPQQPRLGVQLHQRRQQQHQLQQNIESQQQQQLQQQQQQQLQQGNQQAQQQARDGRPLFSVLL